MRGGLGQFFSGLPETRSSQARLPQTFVSTFVPFRRRYLENVDKRRSAFYIGTAFSTFVEERERGIPRKQPHTDVGWLLSRLGDGVPAAQ